jgi:hypothetical protein
LDDRSTAIEATCLAASAAAVLFWTGLGPQLHAATGSDQKQNEKAAPTVAAQMKIEGLNGNNPTPILVSSARSTARRRPAPAARVAPRSSIRRPSC